jgi:hypothetical protein
MATQPFDRGATYRAKKDFDALRDSFLANERLVYWMHAESIYDDKQGWFFYVVGTRCNGRAWDVDGLGDPPKDVPFDRIEDVHPLVAAAEAGRVDEVRALLAPTATQTIDEAYVRVALDVAIDAQQAATTTELVTNGGLDDVQRQRALGEAAVKGKIDVVRSLLAAGIPASGAALGRAIWARDEAMVKLLIAHGADPKSTGRPIEEWIQFLERQNRPDIVRLLSAPR